MERGSEGAYPRQRGDLAEQAAVAGTRVVRSLAREGLHREISEGAEAVVGRHHEDAVVVQPAAHVLPAAIRTNVNGLALGQTAAVEPHYDRAARAGAAPG